MAELAAGDPRGPEAGRSVCVARGGGGAIVISA